MATPKIRLKDLEVLTLDQELMIINKLTLTEDVNKTSKELSVSSDIIRQVALKYSDVIALLLRNRGIAEDIQDAYKATLDKVIKANDKAISLLAHQLDVLYDEYNADTNKGVLIKDYIINQICNIQDRLQKMIDSGLNRYKDAMEVLNKRLSGFSKNDKETEDNAYKENVQSVFEKLNVAKKVVLINKNTNEVKIYDSVAKAAIVLGVSRRDFPDKTASGEYGDYKVILETKEA